MNWSKFQQDVFDAVAHSDDSLNIEAVAGSGKTTTILEAINHVPMDHSCCFLAFNKAIADTLRGRITAPGVRCATLHSVGNSAWRRHLGPESSALRLNTRKTQDIARDILKYEERTRVGRELSRLVSIAKGSGIVPKRYDGGIGAMQGMTPDTDDLWEDIIDFYDLDENACDIGLARKVLAESIRRADKEIDFDDMLYMPVIAEARFDPLYDTIFLDEAQDVNSLQVEMVSRMRSERGRVIAVGDPNQAIYGWRGALSNSMDHIAERFHSRSLPLSISYRCPQAVVRRAQRYVPHILPHESAPEGLVDVAGAWKPSQFLPSDAILCRNNRPLIEAAFLLIRHKVACRVLGRDIGQGLISLIRRMHSTGLDDLHTRLAKHREQEAARYEEKPARLAALDDRLDTIRVFIDELPPDGTVDDLIRSIESLFGEFAEARGVLTLSTIHKSKGLEYSRVFILDAGELMPSKWATQGWQLTQEDNLHYVAITRAQLELRYLSSEALRWAEYSAEDKEEVRP